MFKITLKDAIKQINGKIIVSKDLEEIIENGYCGDFLSNVISRVPKNAMWFTVVNNANVAAVAKLGDVSAIVICEKVKADARLVECCQKENINLIETPLNSFDCALKIGQLGAQK